MNGGGGVGGRLEGLRGGKKRIQGGRRGPPASSEEEHGGSVKKDSFYLTGFAGRVYFALWIRGSMLQRKGAEKSAFFARQAVALL